MSSGITPTIVLLSLLAALHFAAFLLPAGSTWGFHFLRFLGPVFVLWYAAAALALFAAGARMRLDAAAARLGRSLDARPWAWFAGALALFAGAGFLWRIEVPILGDSWYLVSNFAGALRGTDVLLPRNEPLATYYLSLVVGLFEVTTYDRFLDAFFAGGMALGLGFVAAAWFTVRQLFENGTARALSFVLVCTLPAAVLFFGYVETYAAVYFALGLYTLTGLLYLRGRLPFTVVTIAFLLQVLTHYLTALTLPSLLWLAWTGVRQGRGRDVAGGIVASAVTFLVILAAIGFDVSNYFSRVPHRHYLPFTMPDDPVEIYSTAYTLFSAVHLSELANLALLVAAPALVLGAAALLMPRPAGEPARGGAETFLLAAAAPAILFAIAAKYDLGAARDWDILAPFAFLFVLWALVRLRRRAAPALWTRIVVLTAGLTLLNSAAWWTLVGSETATLDRFRSLMVSERLGQVGMYNSHLYLSRYYRQTGRGDVECARVWEDYIACYPGDIRGYRNVLNNTRADGAETAARRIRDWSSAYGKYPLTDKAMVTLAVEEGNAALTSGRDVDAEAFYAAALEVDPRDAAAWNNLGTVHARREEFADAAACFAHAVEIDSAFADAWFNLGRALLPVGRSADARAAFDRAALLGNRAARSLLSTGTVLP